MDKIEFPLGMVSLHFKCMHMADAFECDLHRTSKLIVCVYFGDLTHDLYTMLKVGHPLNHFVTEPHVEVHLVQGSCMASAPLCCCHILLS